MPWTSQVALSRPEGRALASTLSPKAVNTHNTMLAVVPPRPTRAHWLQLSRHRRSRPRFAPRPSPRFSSIERVPTRHTPVVGATRHRASSGSRAAEVSKSCVKRTTIPPRRPVPPGGSRSGLRASVCGGEFRKAGQQARKRRVARRAVPGRGPSNLSLVGGRARTRTTARHPKGPRGAPELRPASRMLVLEWTEAGPVSSGPPVGRCSVRGHPEQTC